MSITLSSSEINIVNITSNSHAKGRSVSGHFHLLQCQRAPSTHFIVYSRILFASNEGRTQSDNSIKQFLWYLLLMSLWHPQSDLVCRLMILIMSVQWNIEVGSGRKHRSILVFSCYTLHSPAAAKRQPPARGGVAAQGHNVRQVISVSVQSQSTKLVCCR